ncbi:hypothetical protein QIH01_20330 [Brevibacillus brevis]|uniref:hypothetical protein n=1 Tax=Brevibacillus sp. MER 51 TaxID=2939560 RepID=UPI002040DB6F|nr:hypothetical protein [Brevibacillus sp. MER 51]MCM3141333.1 hypothetical protein [Brevibacillus sp. MER 51]WGV57821.1 hypothetical protein QIH01_20330 [Brevibacillus brevis]
MSEQKETTADTVVVETSKSNIDVAMNLYQLIRDKPLNDIKEIVEYLRIIVANRIANRIK